jgi:hypothetical protein
MLAAAGAYNKDIHRTVTRGRTSAIICYN